MIQDKSIEQATLLADLLRRNGLCVEAIPGTPAWELTNANLRPLAVLINSSDDISLSEAAKARDVDGSSEYGDVMERLVSVIANSVSDSLHRARNIVMPLVKEVYENVLTSIDEANSAAINPVTIVSDFLSNVWTNPAMVAKVEDYGKTPFEPVRLTALFPPLTEEQLQDLIKTRISHLDNDVQAYLQETTPNALAAAYADIFQGNMGSVELSTLIGNTKSTVDRNRALLGYLIASGLLRSEPLPEVNLSLEEYNLYLSKIMVACARIIARVADEYDRQIKLGLVVSSYPSAGINDVVPGESFIKVNGLVYNKLLEQVDNPDVVLGAYLSDKAMTMDSLLANKDHYLEVWNKQRRLLDSKARAEGYNRAISAMRKAMLMALKDFAIDEIQVSRDTLNDLIISELKCVTEKDLENLFATVRNMVCNVFFKHTDAKIILEKIDYIGEKKPKADIREVALDATIDYICEWVGKLLVVKPI